MQQCCAAELGSLALEAWDNKAFPVHDGQAGFLGQTWQFCLFPQIKMCSFGLILGTNHQMIRSPAANTDLASHKLEVRSDQGSSGFVGQGQGMPAASEFAVRSEQQGWGSSSSLGCLPAPRGCWLPMLWSFGSADAAAGPFYVSYSFWGLDFELSLSPGVPVNLNKQFLSQPIPCLALALCPSLTAILSHFCLCLHLLGFNWLAITHQTY